MFLEVYTVSVIAIITAIVIYLWIRFTYWSRRNVPGPQFVEYQGFLTKHHDWTLQQIQKYGRIYGTFDFLSKGIVVNEPDLIRDIMSKDFHIFTDRKHMYTGSSKLSKSLFFLSGNEDWKRIRAIVSPTFTSAKLKAMMSNISDISDKFVANLEVIALKGEPIDMRKYVGAFAMDVISVCAYGINTDSIDNPNHPLVINAKKILNVDANLSVLLSVFAPPVAKFFNLEPFDSIAANYFDALTNKLVEKRKKQNENQENSKSMKRTDFLQLMIDMERSDEDIDMEPISDEESFKVEENNIKVNDNQNEKTLSSDEMTAQGILFFIAGYDTTSAAISHSIYYLSQYLECQQKLYEELQNISDFSYETLNKLKYLNAVIKETLRLAPSLTRVQRNCNEDYKLGNTGITIPAGTTIEILPYALHRDPEFFPDPELFKPERFISSSGEPTHHPYAYIPFGGGPRLCIGMRFALNEMRMCIAKLVNKFEFTLAPDFKIDYFNGNILLTPKELMVNMKARI